MNFLFFFFFFLGINKLLLYCVVYYTFVGMDCLPMILMPSCV